MSLPSAWPSYARMLVSRRPALAPPGFRLEGLAVEARGVVAPAAALAAYREVCGFDPDAGVLPVTYPHVLANALHLALLAGPVFPVRPLGLVHLKSTTRALRELPDAAALDLRCALEGPRETDRGQEFDLVTEVREAGALAWSETSVVLARRPGATGGKKASAAAGPGSTAVASPPIARFELGSDLGRRYAAASGDWNPIHLTVITARLFGFRRPIAHGMWTLARCAAELSVPGGGVALEASFKLPVLLPATVTLRSEPATRGTRFSLRDADGAKPHLVGTIHPL